MPDEPKYQAHFGPKFAEYFENYPPDQRVAILKFVSIYQIHGLDKTKFEGKLSPTWHVSGEDPDYYTKVEYARRNELWHYHIGIPNYKQSPNGYLTSDMVLHMQRHDEYNITLLDCYFHYKADGTFYVPSAEHLP